MLDNKLYSDIPPTKLRNIKEVFTEASNDPFWVWMCDQYMFRMVENNFHALRIKNKNNFEKRNKNYANIIYAPHSNWWDGQVGYNLCRRVFGIKIRMMIEELNRFPILSKAGAFSINKQSAQESMKALKYAVEMLEDSEIGLWIFPQGIVRPPNYRPIEFQTGMTYIAQNCVKKYGGINLIPIALNYAFLRESRPEVFVEVGEPIVLKDTAISRKNLTEQLEHNFTQLCDQQMIDIYSGNLSEYEVSFQAKFPWWKRLEHRLKRIDKPQIN